MSSAAGGTPKCGRRRLCVRRLHFDTGALLQRLHDGRESFSGPISSQVSLSSAGDRLDTSIGTPSAFASETNRFTSFIISPAVNP